MIVSLEKLALDAEPQDMIFVLKEPYIKSPTPDYTDFILEYASIDASERDSPFLDHLEFQLQRHGMSKDDAENFVMAVREVIQNAQEHAYNFEPGKKVEVAVRYTPYADFVGVYSTNAPKDLLYLMKESYKNTLENLSLGKYGKVTRRMGTLILNNICDFVGIIQSQEDDSYVADIVLAKLKKAA